MENTGRKEEKG